MVDKTNKLTVYLIKPEFVDFSAIVTDQTDSIELPEIGTFYVERSIPRPPGWLSTFFKSKLDERLKEVSILTASAKALLLVRLPDGEKLQVFALSFGQGRHLLKDDVIEERFGLKIVLNSVAKDSLRSIDKVTLGSIPKQSREQISRESAAGSFGIDVEQDLISAVTGKSKILEFGRTISGRDAFAASAKIDIDNLVPFLSKCLEQFRSEDYRIDFDWIDQISELKSKRHLFRLNNSLIEKINNNELDNIWMAPPDIIEWSDVKGFRYQRRKRAELVDDLDVRSLIDICADDALSIEWLKETSVYLISSRTDDAVANWTAYRCIHAEIELEGVIYILNAGKWYEIASDFSSQVKEAFHNIPDAELICLDYEHKNEAEYNKALTAALDGACCLDAKMINYGGGKSSIEFCDVLTSDKRLLHVKRYSGSAQLSHLFAQGAVSGELFVSDALFRAKLNEKLADGHKLADVETRPNPQDYEVVFAIISKSAKPLSIPFFSKVSLRNAYRRLHGYGYRVAKKKIQVREVNS